MQSKLLLLRKDKRVTQAKLAEILGITTKQYGAKESGKVKFNGDEMFKIAEYFDTKIDDIFLPTNHRNGELIKENIKE